MDRVRLALALFQILLSQEVQTYSERSSYQTRLLVWYVMFEREAREYLFSFNYSEYSLVSLTQLVTLTRYHSNAVSTRMLRLEHYTLEHIEHRYRELTENEDELERLMEQERNQFRKVTEKQTTCMVLRRMQSRLRIVLNHELQQHIEELRSSVLDIIYDSFFRVRFLNNFDMYLKMNAKRRRDTIARVSENTLSAREKSEVLQAKHFEALVERFHVSKDSLDRT